MTRSLLGEWTKMRTVPSNVAIGAALAVLMVAGTVAIIASIDGPRSGLDAVTLSLSGVHLGQLAAVALAAVVVVGEFQPRMLRTTLAMNPRRGTVYTAKAAVIAATVLVAGAAGVGGSALAGWAMLEGHWAASPRAAFGTVLYLVLVALLSTGVATALRHAGGSIGAVVALLYGPYLLTLVVPLPLRTLHLIQDVSPMTAGLAAQAEIAGSGTAPLGPWAGLGVLAAYTFAALALGGGLFAVRDA
jgi:ABC-2 type transport system permease protein